MLEEFGRHKIGRKPSARKPRRNQFEKHSPFTVLRKLYWAIKTKKQPVIS